MNVTGKTCAVELTTKEFIDIIPETAWDIIEKALLKKASLELNEQFTSIEDYYDIEGSINILVSN